MPQCRQTGHYFAPRCLIRMVTARRPTRAEASDVANAVLDGTVRSCCRQKPALGDHPVTVVETMARIIRHVEEQSLTAMHSGRAETKVGSTARALTRAACQVGESVGATHLCTFTETGLTTRLVARHHHRFRWLHSRQVSGFARNFLVWGVENILTPHAETTDEMVQLVDNELLALRRCEPGDRVVVVAGCTPGNRRNDKRHAGSHHGNAGSRPQAFSGRS